MQDGNGKYRSWAFTINNWTEEGYVILIHCMKKNGALHYVVGKEIGKECGTPHLQGYVRFKSQKTLNTLKKKIDNRAHWEPARDNTKAAEYCKKDGDFEEFGEQAKQGERNDLKEVREMIKNGANIKEIMESADNLMQIKIAEKLIPYFQEKRKWKPLVKWYYGDPGSGKTKAAIEEMEEILGNTGEEYYKIDGGNMKWWEGYYGQKNIIIDDIRKDSIKFNYLLNLLDRYESRVEVKGGSSQFLAKFVIITCPYSPQVCFGKQTSGNTDLEGEDKDKELDSINQLLRRIDVINRFKKNN